MPPRFGGSLTSYYIYDQPVLAPTDGTVTYALDSRPDQPIGSVDRGLSAERLNWLV